MLEIDDRLSIPLRELDFSFSRSGGPGGQNVNKVNTKVTLRWNVADSRSLPDAVKGRFQDRFRNRINQEGELVLTSQRFRNQGRNVADCLAKLRELLQEVARPPRPRKRTRPTKASRALRLHDKRKTSDKKRLRRPPTPGD